VARRWKSYVQYIDRRKNAGIFGREKRGGARAKIRNPQKAIKSGPRMKKVRDRAGETEAQTEEPLKVAREWKNTGRERERQKEEKESGSAQKVARRG
jgi:hypothetical protein